MATFRSELRMIRRTACVFAFLAAAAVLSSPGTAQVRRPVSQRPVTQRPISDATIQQWKVRMAQNPNTQMYQEWNQIPADRAVTELRPFLFDVDPAMRVAAAYAISELRARPASGAIAMGQAIDSAPDVATKIGIGQALNGYGAAGSPAVPALVRALAPTAKEGVADQITMALIFIGPAAAPAAERLVAMLDDSTTLFNGQNMLNIGQYVVVMGNSIAQYGPRLVHALELGRVGGMADSALDKDIGTMGQPTTDALIAALSHPQKAVNASMGVNLLDALGYSRSAAAIPVLLHHATTKPKRYEFGTPQYFNENADLRVGAIDALGHMGSAGAPALGELSRIAATASTSLTEFDQPGLMLAAQRAIHSIRADQISH